jgi:hypothetical protein
MMASPYRARIVPGTAKIQDRASVRKASLSSSPWAWVGPPKALQKYSLAVLVTTAAMQASIQALVQKKMRAQPYKNVWHFGDCSTPSHASQGCTACGHNGATGIRGGRGRSRLSGLIAR